MPATVALMRKLEAVQAERDEMKFEVTNRFTGAVQFTAEIECAEDAPRSIKLGELYT